MTEENLTPPPYISASSLSTFLQCPLKYKYSRIDRLPEPPTEATLRGNFVHDVLEALYGLEPESRTQQNARSLARALWDDKWMEEVIPYIHESQLNEFRWSSWWCIEALWKLEDPTSITPSGLETEINVEINGVAIKGFIDRYEFMDDELIVSDYKTGKTPAVRYRADKYTQLMLYASGLRELGVGTATKIQLLYLKTGDLVDKKVQQTDYVAVNTLLRGVKDDIDRYCEEGTFPTSTSRLCDWCSYKPFCPAWEKK